MKNKKHLGFTLIELLVVVLIIGILAAVAVPQYKKAVVKSRYSTVKHIVRSIASAMEVYYIANNKYATDLSELDVDKPNSTEVSCSLDAGGHEIYCKNVKDRITYKIDLVLSPNNAWCVAAGTDVSSFESKFCKAETGATTPAQIGDSWVVWVYK